MNREQMTRRGLLISAGAVLAARGGPAQTKPRGVRFGVRTPLPKLSLRERALLVGRLGYDGIELGREWLDQPVEAIKEQLAGRAWRSARSWDRFSYWIRIRRSARREWIWTGAACGWRKNWAPIA